MQPFGSYALIVLLLMGICIALNYFLPHLHNNIADMLYRSAIITAIYAGGILISKIAPEAQEFLNKKILKK